MIVFRLSKHYSGTVCLLFVLFSVGVLLTSNNAVAAAVPPACIDDFDKAIEDGDLRALSDAFANRPTPDPCDVNHLDFFRTQATKLVVNKADELVYEDGNYEEAAKLLNKEGEATFGLVSMWGLNAVLGDIAFGQGDMKEAASQYNVAYELSLGSVPNANVKREPAEEEIQLLMFNLANEAMQLAKNMDSAISRGGEATGTMVSRGPKPRRIPMPLEFALDSDELTADSLDKVKAIVAFLEKDHIQELTIVGHTDWQGDDAYNQHLSEKRAQTVATALKQALKQNGSTMQIQMRTVGKGEVCPRVLSDRTRYTQEQQEALDRRVELEWPREQQSSLPVCDESARILK